MKVGIVGTGAVGSIIGTFLRENNIPALELAGVHGIVPAQAEQLASALSVPFLPFEELLERSDLLVEATAAAAMPEIVRAAVSAGRKIIALSVGGFASDPGLMDFVEAHPGKLYLPSGGVTGIDGLLALREIGLRSVNITTTKSPRSLNGAPFFRQKGHETLLEGLTGPVTVFSGSAREAISAFPANTNLAISVSLGGIGFDRTQITIIADPQTTRTRQHLHAEAGDCVLDTVVEGVPLPENPRTSLLAASSVKALLRKVAARVSLGS